MTDGRETPPGSLTAHARFWRSCIDAFLLFRSVHNVAVFVIAGFLSASTELFPGSVVMDIVAFAVVLLLFAFFVEIIGEVARGEDDFPIIGDTDDYRGLFLYGLVALLLTFALLVAPLYVYMHWIIQRPSGGMSFDQILTALAICAGGAALWPMWMLLYATGGAGALLRVDVAVTTFFRAPLAYFTVVVGVFAAFALQVAVHEAIRPNWMDEVFEFAYRIFDPAYGRAGRVFRTIVSDLMATYVAVVSMSLTGLFYRHFRHRFPWGG